jgi:hypothetical protein
VTQNLAYRIGADASCSDGDCGHLSRIIVNPADWQVTHLVVEPKFGNGAARFVPVGLADATKGQLRLRCTRAEFHGLPPAQETETVTELDPTGHRDPTINPNFLPMSAGAVWQFGERGPSQPRAPQEVTVDSVPSGEVDIRHELVVCATDGELGQVQGLVVEPGGGYGTHVLLQGAHMWGRKEVAIPIGAVTKIGTLLLHLNLTRHQVRELPPVDVDQTAG